eukprot:1342111-Amorphochlora_amoeboformis.AAC.1
MVTWRCSLGTAFLSFSLCQIPENGVWIPETASYISRISELASETRGKVFDTRLDVTLNNIGNSPLDVSFWDGSAEYDACPALGGVVEAVR